MTSITTTCTFGLKLAVWPAALSLALPGCDTRPRLAPGEVLPTSVLRIESAINSELVENSVAITSVRQPGVIFGLNDSGHRPRIFAFDSSGRDLGRWELYGARNRDWEAAAAGPCLAADTLPSCIYIGDVGDNDANRTYVEIYRIAEPTAPGSRDAEPAPLMVLGRISVKYPDRPHDVEAMYVTPDRALFLITKRRFLDKQRRPRQALVYRIPPDAWDSSGVVIATLVDSLPIIPGATQGRQVNDAALSPDGKTLAVRTYSEVFIFAVDSGTGLPVQGIAPITCFIRFLREELGEGVGWWWDGRRLLLTSERRSSPLYVVQCPLPAVP